MAWVPRLTWTARVALWLIVVCAMPNLARGQLLHVPGGGRPAAEGTAGPPSRDQPRLQMIESVLSHRDEASDAETFSQTMWSSDGAAPYGAAGCADCGHWHGWGQSCDARPGHWGYGGWTDASAPEILLRQSGTLLKHSSFAPRHVGRGHPLEGTSWLNRPIHGGWFMGTLFGDEVIKNRVDQNSDFFGGYRLGWDCDHYWGAELRLAFSALNLKDNNGVRLPDTNDVFLGDVSLLYYPWGDSRWRPYFLTGLGLGHFHFQDELGNGQDGTLLGIPVGGGLKYQYRRWLAVRLELLDNIALANDGLATMHNVSLTLGVEVHHGAHPRSYWPWHPSRTVW